MKSKFIKLRLRTQIFIILSILMLLNITIFITLYQYTSQLYIEQIQEQTQRTLSIVQGSIDREISIDTDYLVTISYNKQINECIKILSDENTHFSENFLAAQELESNRKNFLNYNNYITSIQFYDADGNILSGTYDSLISQELKKYESEFMQSQLSYKHIAFPFSERLVIFQKIYDIYDTTQSDTIGAVSICYNIKKMINDLNIIDMQNYKLNLSYNNIPVYTTFDVQGKANYDSEIIDIGNIKYCSVSSDSQIMDLTYTIFSNISYANNSTKNIAAFVLICSIIDLMIFLGISILLNFVMLLPLNKLYARTIEYSNSNNYDSILNSDLNTSNELQLLSVKCCNLVQKANELGKKQLETQAELAKAELEMLYSQINPHFLYNTLDSIYWLSLPCDDRRISEMTKALSDMFRIATNNDELIVPLSNELSIFNSYLSIQRYRFANRLKIYVNCDTDLYQIPVPKLILQPLVENSIKYVLEKVSTVCIIEVNIFKSDNCLHIEVVDNGPEIVENYQNPLIADNKFGVGIHNICRRLELAYGKNSQVSFFIRDTYKFVASITINQID